MELERLYPEKLALAPAASLHIYIASACRRHFASQAYHMDLFVHFPAAGMLGVEWRKHQDRKNGIAPRAYTQIIGRSTVI
jgi:hypothetical protein